MVGAERTHSAPGSAPARGNPGPLALAVADAGWFTTESLFGEVRGEGVATLLLRCMDYRNAWQKGGRPWSWGGPLRECSPNLWKRELVLPSGWMKRFPRLGMRPIARSVRVWRRRLRDDRPLALVMTYPHYVSLRDMLRPAKSLYFNLDDYALYWPGQAGKVRALERRAVRESDLTVCVSRLRAEELKAAVPKAAGRVRHLPHGTPSWAITEAPCERPSPPPGEIAHLPRPLLGYVGSLEDRVDWDLLTALSRAFPRASLVLVGRPPIGAGDDDWRASARRCLARPNVHAVGWRPQDEIPRYNRAFDVCLIPYRVDHPFNHACCPTKIMDSMGTGRPLVSTALPECRLYAHLFDVAEGHEGFISAVGSVLASGSDDGRAGARHAHARRNSCARVADRLLSWIAG